MRTARIPALDGRQSAGDRQAEGSGHEGLGRIEVSNDDPYCGSRHEGCPVVGLSRFVGRMSKVQRGGDLQ